jgi:hypothetical protein
MLIWTGRGFLVFVIVFGFSLVLNFAFNTWWGEGYYDTHKWPFAISLLLSAIVCWIVGSALRKGTSRTVIDKETGEELVLNRNHHSLFFIPMHIWAPILVVIGCVLLVVDLFR